MHSAAIGAAEQGPDIAVETIDRALNTAFGGHLTRRCWLPANPPGGAVGGPCTLAGDFDGDGKPDRAILVAEGAGARRAGIAVLFANGRAVRLGAGVTVGSGGDDFSWMDHWHLLPHAQAAREWGGAPMLAGDALWVERSEAASALLGWARGRFRWRQQAD